MKEETTARRSTLWPVIGGSVLIVAVGIGIALLTRPGMDVPEQAISDAADSSEAAETVAPEEPGSEEPVPEEPDVNDESETPLPIATPTVPPKDIPIGGDTPRPTQTPQALTPTNPGLLPELEPVPIDAVIIAEESVQVSLTKLEAVTGEADVAGEISGPAVRATVRVENGSSEPLDLGFIVVNAYYGDGRIPAGSLMQPGGTPFEGSLAPGETAEGIYLFSISEEERKNVTIGVDYLEGAATAVFTGDVG